MNVYGVVEHLKALATDSISALNILSFIHKVIDYRKNPCNIIPYHLCL
jgi:hypothetical protein